VSNRREHYSRTCWDPEEIIDRKERDNLARVDVRLEPGSCALQVGNGQALRHAKILLVGMTADTARSRPIARLLTILVSSMPRKAPCRPNETERGKGSQPVNPRARIGFQMDLAFLRTDDHVDSRRAVFDQGRHARPSELFNGMQRSRPLQWTRRFLLSPRSRQCGELSSHQWLQEGFQGREAMLDRSLPLFVNAGV
jgi:hypothetical protein